MLSKHSSIFALLVMTVVFVSFSQVGQTEELKDSPNRISGSTKVTADELIELASKNDKLVIIDSRIPNDRTQGYIEGSKSLPDEKTSCQSLAELIPNKTTPTVYYCNGPKCGRSAIAVKIALSCQYKNIYWFRGGYEVWVNSGYPVIKE